MHSFDGYEIKQQLQHGDHKLVFKAVRQSNNRPVILKYYQTDTSTYTNLPHIRNTFSCLHKIHSPYLVNVDDLVFAEEGVAVITEYFSGQSLQCLLATQHVLSLTQVLNIIDRVSAGLVELHSKKIIHQAITPNNIALIDGTNEVKIIGFGICRYFYQQTQSKQLVNLLYMSPEQTGRMNRSIDRRSDLYSLGVVFYELLTGQPPFQSTDVLELIHAHIAQQPVAPHKLNCEIPIAVSNIVLKLLCKEAEYRYQSASGLNADIRACLEQLENNGNISDSFEIGKLDLRSQFQIPEKLYGRSREIQQLLNTFENSAAGGFETILVAGYSGVGKSALINEIQKPLVAKRGLYTSGKYDQFKKAQPHSAILQAFSYMVRQVLAKSKLYIDDWANTLLDEFNAEGQCLVEVMPVLQSLIGQQNNLPELNSVETLARFNRNCVAFIRAFSTQSHPFILFLDDLQWADLASLNLIDHLLRSRIPYMMLIMAYRDNEVDSHHPFSTLMQNSKEEGLHLQEISLQPINLLDTQNLVSDTLHKDLSQVEPLAQELMLKTQGNPFFLTQLFTSLHQEEQILFNRNTGWQWDMERIRQASISGDVVELMTRKLKQYPPSTQSALNMCAILGAEFKLSMASLGLEQDIDTTYQSLLPAIQGGLLVEMGKRLKFTHDKIHESSYALWPKAKRTQRHALIAKYMLEILDEASIDAEIFSIVEHFNHSSEVVTDVKQRIELAKFNYRAGRKAKQSSAFEPAVEFFQKGKNYLDESIWQLEPDFAFELHFFLAQTAYTTARFELSENTIKLCMSHEKEQIKITPVVQLYQDLLFASSRHDEGIAFALKKLNEYGLSLPANPGKLSVMAEYMMLKFRQRLRSTDTLHRLPQTTDNKRLSMMAIIANMVPSCYMVNGDLMGFISLRMANLSLKYGNNIYSSFGYAMTGLVETGILKRIKSGRKYYDLSITLEELYPNKLIKGRNMMLMSSFAAPWTEPVTHYKKMMEEARSLNDDLGILQWADYCVVFTRAQSLFFGRDNLSKIHKENLKWLTFHIKNGDQQVIANQKYIMHMIEYFQASRGTEEKKVLDTEHEVFDVNLHACTISQQQNVTFQAYYHVLKQMDGYLLGDYKSCVLEGTKLFMMVLNTFGICLDVIHRYFYSLAYLALDKTKLSLGQRIKTNLYFRLNFFCLWLYKKNRADNYGAHYALLKAELYRSKNRHKEALDYYEESIQLSGESSLFNEALANERLADFHQCAERKQSALLYAAQARKLYKRWGNNLQVERINSRYPDLVFVGEADRASSSVSLSVDDHQQLELTSLTRGSQAISSEVKIHLLVETLLKQLIQIAGAEKAILLLEEDGQLLVYGEIDGQQNNKNTNFMSDKARAPNSATLAESVIRYVARSKSREVLAHAAIVGNFTQDPYVISRKLKSLLCMPILNQGELVGVLYLENNLITNAFTQRHQEVLEILASQAAISVVNARLYTHLEDKVSERTRELHETIDQLTEAKKIAALGRVVAGVAHEINTPLGIGLTSSTFLKNNIEEITKKFQAASMTKTEFEQFLKLSVEITDMLLINIGRAIKLVERFKSTAVGQSEENKVSFNVEGFLKDIVASFSEKLQKDHHVMLLECHKDIEMRSYPVALELIISNLISNSLDHGFVNRQGGNITLSVSESKYSEDHNILIEYHDDGIGIKEDDRSKVFDPFFTTNMGENAGLGLHIIYNVITNQFSGSIRCEVGDNNEGVGAHFYISIPKGA